MGLGTLFNTLKISGTGMRAQRIRIDAIASNLANVNSTRTPEGGPYKRKVPIFAEVFDDSLKQTRDPREDPFNGVAIAGIVPAQECFKKVYDPGHPDADETGFVIVPNINPMEEMVNLIDASRAYEANLSTIRNTKQIIADTLRILRA
ncbi:MAG TPA: flagellar basal body rod protein FlgC [Desulfobacterales bacterium]|nr:flagellar basal body rod protein FlgC [Desulfobacterales bacterium]